MDSPTQNQTEVEVSNSVENENLGSTSDSPAENLGAEADSPPAKETSLADRIKAETDRIAQKDDAEEGDSGKEDAPEAEESDSQDKEETPESTEEDDFTEEEYSQLKSKTRKSIERLRGQVEEYKTEADDFKRQLQELQTPAQEYTKLRGFLDEHGISGEDANAAFQLLADMKRDPQKAEAQFEQILMNLRHQTGSALPEDLQKRVDGGWISEADAKEMSKLRAQQSRHAFDQQERVRIEEAQRQRQAVENGKQIGDAISKWEQKWAASDPDYQKKQNLVQNAIYVALGNARDQGRMPNTVEAAIQLAEKCKTDIENVLRTSKPKVQQIRHVSGGSAVVEKSRPSSLSDAILAAVNG